MKIQLLTPLPFITPLPFNVLEHTHGMFVKVNADNSRKGI
jgi:hypothetical protein